MRLLSMDKKRQVREPTAQPLVMEINLRNLDHSLSVPSPSVKPSPGRKRGLYTSWHAHWWPYACIAEVAN